MPRIFKIMSAEHWAKALANGVFSGAAIDLQDGYIHFSDATQVEETAKRHFAGQPNLILIAFDSESLGNDLRWETSRGGALFPHLYATLNPALALWAKPLPWDGNTHRFPDNWQS